jgi:hypothetical protein
MADRNGYYYTGVDLEHLANNDIKAFEQPSGGIK